MTGISLFGTIFLAFSHIISRIGAPDIQQLFRRVGTLEKTRDFQDNYMNLCLPPPIDIEEVVVLDPLDPQLQLDGSFQFSNNTTLASNHTTK